jgi:hypothetical protein
MVAASFDAMGLGEDNNCPSFWLGILLCHIWCPVSQTSCWWHQVLSGLRLDSLFCLRALGIKLELQIDSATLGMRILSMVMVFL